MIDIAECKASLWFSGDTLDPEELAHKLGQTPTYGIRRGEIYLSETGEEMVASTGKFQFTTGWQTGKPLEQIIVELLGQVTDDLSLWTRINSTLSSEVFCGPNSR